MLSKSCWESCRYNMKNLLNVKIKVKVSIKYQEYRKRLNPTSAVGASSGLSPALCNLKTVQPMTTKCSFSSTEAFSQHLGFNGMLHVDPTHNISSPAFCQHHTKDNREFTKTRREHEGRRGLTIRFHFQNKRNE